jgi:electron transfer flavoprotein beta subunit
MKVLVPVKRVPDYAARIKVRPDGSGVETESVKWIVNPFDEIAVEEAIRQREGGKVSEIVVVGIGPKESEAQLRYAMAMGADSAILVESNSPVDSDLAARVLAAIWSKGEYGFVIMGKQAIDSDSGQTPQLLAAYLHLPQACFASKVVLEGSFAIVTREVDGGLETVRFPLPGIISTDLRLNEPRYAPLPGIMKAKKKPLEIVSIESLGVEMAPKIEVKAYSTPAKKKAGRKVGSVEELISALQNEAKVL